MEVCMSISLFSVAVLLLTAVFVLFEIARGIKKGFYATLVRVCLVLLSVVLSFIAARMLSDLFVDKLYQLVFDMGIFGAAFDYLPGAGNVIKAYCDAVITPFVFVCVYPLMILIVKVIVYFIKEKHEDFNDLDIKIKKESAPWVEKHQRLLSIVISAACGVFISSMFISPIMGSLKMVGKAVELGRTLGGEDVAIEESMGGIEAGISKYKDDPVANLVYYCGGNVVYFANASSELNGNYFTLGKELKNTAKYYDEIISAAKLMGRIDKADPKEVRELQNIEKYINKSETLKAIASDFVSEISGSWIEGEEFMGLERPSVTSAISPVLNRVLYVCSQTTPRFVAEDMGTLIDLYILLYESDIIGSSNYSEMVSLIDDTSFLEKVSDILKDNPRMKDISLDFENMTVSIISAALLSDAISQREFKMIAGDIADAVNNVRELPREEQISIVADNAYRTINENGLEVPFDVIQTTAERLVDDIETTKGDITAGTIENFFEKYSADLGIE